MDLRIKYSGLGSYYEQIIPSTHQYYQPILSHEFCTEDHPSLIPYAATHNCSISWATATIAAAELALHQRGIEEKLSLEYLLECFKDEIEEDSCEGVSMSDLQEFLMTVGLMSEKEVNRVGDEMCSLNAKDGKSISSELWSQIHNHTNARII